MSGEHTIDEEGERFEQPSRGSRFADHAERGLPQLRAFCEAAPSRLGGALLGIAATRRRTEVVEFCDRWRGERRPLVDACERQIPWFATHVELATDNATRAHASRA